MSAAQIYALKAIMRAFGLNADELESKAIQLQSVILEFDPNELRAALKTLLDYRRNQEQNEKRILAIMDHLGISDPCSLSLTEDIPNGQTDI